MAYRASRPSIFLPGSPLKRARTLIADYLAAGLPPAYLPKEE